MLSPARKLWIWRVLKLAALLAAVVLLFIRQQDLGLGMLVGLAMGTLFSSAFWAKYVTATLLRPISIWWLPVFVIPMAGLPLCFLGWPYAGIAVSVASLLLPIRWQDLVRLSGGSPAGPPRPR